VAYISNTAAQWTRQVLTDMWRSIRVSERNSHFHVKYCGFSWLFPLKPDIGDIDMDLSSIPLNKLLDSHQKRFVVHAVLPSLKAAASRIFFIDYGGTIVSREEMGMFVKTDYLGVSSRSPDDDMLRAIRALAANEKNLGNHIILVNFSARKLS
jgi:hypothetical protein